MACHDLLNVLRDMGAADVECMVLLHEAVHAAHVVIVVAVVAVLVAPKAVDGGVE